ncbi:MAG: alkaline phosphatase family protein, partial [Ruminococcus sp.]|nr:alkaline phosphatase family protein [Candidatus Copronaster equi]
MENNQKCISSICATVLKLLNVDIPNDIDSPNEELLKITPKADKVVLYNPDAVAWWLYEKYPDIFAQAKECSAKATKLRSVMPSVTPVCFASMYTGLMPEKHGIQKYEKPVLTVDTMFDYLVNAGKKVAIVSTKGDSISKIFLERNMDYFIYSMKSTVNRKAEKLIKEGEYDVIVIYNADYDSTMHANGPEHKKSLKHLSQNIKTYKRFVSIIKKTYINEKVFYGFCPDHGCHEIDGGRGSHGLEMEEDM